MNAELAHLIRAEGYSKPAGFGGILNIILDPIFIFAFRLNIEGAAIATMLSNLIAMGYFLGFLYHIRKNTVITPNPKTFSIKQLRRSITWSRVIPIPPSQAWALPRRSTCWLTPSRRA